MMSRKVTPFSNSSFVRLWAVLNVSSFAPVCPAMDCATFGTTNSSWKMQRMSFFLMYWITWAMRWTPGSPSEEQVS